MLEVYMAAPLRGLEPPIFLEFPNDGAIGCHVSAQIYMYKIHIIIGPCQDNNAYSIHTIFKVSDGVVMAGRKYKRARGRQPGRMNERGHTLESVDDITQVTARLAG
jgi:hypothetical protein